MRTRARSRALAAATSVLLLVLAGCTADADAPVPEADVVDLLQQDWQHVPGVTAGDDGLRVTATGRSVLGPDGETRQADPPLDLAGTHLVVEGDVELTALLTDVTADATWALYDRPPVVADEFRLEPAGLRLTLRGDDLEVAVFDGSLPRTSPTPSRCTRRT